MQTADKQQFKNILLSHIAAGLLAETRANGGRLLLDDSPWSEKSREKEVRSSAIVFAARTALMNVLRVLMAIEDCTRGQLRRKR